MLLAIGLAVAGLTLVVQRVRPLPATVAKIAAADWVLVQAGGLRLASAACHDDLVLVLLDHRSAAELGDIRTAKHDLSVYRQLFAGGARCVYDTRVLAAADQATLDEFLPLLQQMAQLRPDGSLMRDANVKLDLLSPSQAAELAPLMVGNPPSGPAHALPILRSRIYPLTAVTPAGSQEGAALQLARHAWGVKPLTARPAASWGWHTVRGCRCGHGIASSTCSAATSRVP